MINQMPENVISNIMDRLPIQEAVRTSILSTNWRFTWTLLSQLVLDRNFFKYLLSKNHIHLFYKRSLAKVLLQLKGSITKFVLYIPYQGYQHKHKKEYDEMYGGIVEDINHWILFLSTKGIKDFTLLNWSWSGTQLKLPNHIFLCLELKHLKLRNCCLHPVPGIHCLPKLLDFDFDEVTFDGCKYGEFITMCPLLEHLRIDCGTPIGEVKLGDIAKLVNLKKLSLRLCKLGDTVVTSSNIFDLMASLPKLEMLGLNFDGCEILAKADASKRLSANLHHLMKLELEEIDFKNYIMVECVCDLINGLPNLHTLKVLKDMFARDREVPPDVSKVVCSIKRNLQLQYVELEDFSCSKIHVCFIKSLLVYSPLLKKMVIEGSCSGHRNNSRCSFARKLLKLRRASPNAKIYLD